MWLLIIILFNYRCESKYIIKIVLILYFMLLFVCEITLYITTISISYEIFIYYFIIYIFY